MNTSLNFLKADAAQSGVFALADGCSVNRLGFGAMRITGPGIWGEPKDPANARRVLQRAVELGVNFIDTADSYGPEVSERLIAEALHPYPAGLVIATKGGLTRQGPDQWTPNGQAEYLRQCVEKSLRRLRVDCIELYQLHRIDPNVPVDESLGVLKEMQQAGKIRHVGVSEVSVAELKFAQKILPIVSAQNLYNIGNRQSETVLEYCESHHIGFIPWFPIAAGDLAKVGGPLDQAARRHGATVGQLALAWLLYRSPVMLPIPGTSSIAHLEENIASAAFHLSDAEWQEIEEAIQPQRY